jgi:hypothetical protein
VGITDSGTSQGNKGKSRAGDDYFGDSDEHVEVLPGEASVRAFVERLSPTIPPRSADDERSLGSAFDRFVADARAWNSALPVPMIDDEDLARLASFPAASPAKPSAEPVPSTRTQQDSELDADNTTTTPIASASERKPPIGVALIFLLLGLAGGYGVFKATSKPKIDDAPAAVSKTTAHPSPGTNTSEAADPDKTRAMAQPAANAQQQEPAKGAAQEPAKGAAQEPAKGAVAAQEPAKGAVAAQEPAKGAVAAQGHLSADPNKSAQPDKASAADEPASEKPTPESKTKSKGEDSVAATAAKPETASSDSPAATGDDGSSKPKKKPKRKAKAQRAAKGKKSDVAKTAAAGGKKKAPASGEKAAKPAKTKKSGWVDPFSN